MSFSSEFNAAAKQVGRSYVSLVRIYNIPCPLGGTTEFLFSGRKSQDLFKRLGLAIYPLVDKIPGSKTQITPSAFASSSRVTTTVGMWDVFEGPTTSDVHTWFDPACTPVTDGPTFWQTFIRAFPDYFGSSVDIIGFFDEASMTALSQGAIIRSGQLESIRFKANRKVDLKVRDHKYFRNRTLPASISSENKLTAGIGSTATNLPVTTVGDFSDPDDLESQDWPPISAAIDTELIAFQHQVASTLEVCRNYLGQSENLATSPWVQGGTVGITLAEENGPWAGSDLNSTRIEFTGGVGTFGQDTIETAVSRTFTFSIWVKIPDLPTTASHILTIVMENSTGTEGTSLNVTPTTDWVRHEVTNTFTGGASGFARAELSTIAVVGNDVMISQPLMNEGASRENYVPTVTNQGAFAGRGYAGTTAASHSLGDEVSETMAFFNPKVTAGGLHPVRVFQALANFGSILASRVDSAQLKIELDLTLSDSVRRIISSPRKIAELVGQLSKDTLLDFWSDEAGQVTGRASYRTKRIGQVIPVISETDQILAGTVDVNDGLDNRITRTDVYFDIRTDSDGREESGTKPDDYSKVIVTETVLSLTLSKRTEFFFTHWLYRDQEAGALGSREIARFERGADGIKMKVGYRGRPDLLVGLPFVASSRQLMAVSGTKVEKTDQTFQALSAQDKGDGTSIDVVGLEAIGLNLAIYHEFPTTATTYDADKASQPELLVFAYYAGADGTLGADQDPPDVYG